MIQRTPEYDEFCRRQMVEDKLSHADALRIYEALHHHAVSVGAIRSENILEGIEVDVRIAKAVNGVGRAGRVDKKRRAGTGRP